MVTATSIMMPNTYVSIFKMLLAYYSTKLRRVEGCCQWQYHTTGEPHDAQQCNGRCRDEGPDCSGVAKVRRHGPPFQPQGADGHKTLAECQGWPLTWPKTQIRLTGHLSATSIVRPPP